MMLSLVDRDGRATIAAAEAQAALGVGDTPRAREKFAEAGAALEKSIASVRSQSEKHLTRFLAATQYYKGGDYGKTLELCKKIEQRLLPAEVRSLFPTFLQDVRSRATEGYETRVRRELMELWLRKDHQRILQLLQEHPYVLPGAGMALMRAVVCEYLKNYRAAALFYADAVRLNPDDPNPIFYAAASPLAALLSEEGKVEEAWQYVRHLLDRLPHPVTHLAASLLCFRRAQKLEGHEQKQLLEDQAGHFRQARAGFVGLPSEQQANREIRALMLWGFEAAALGLQRRGELQRACTVCDEAIAFEPNAPEAYTLRGILTYPEAGALDDFRKAVTLGDDSYFPCYFLAHDSMTKDDFQSALTWSQQALRKAVKPGARIESQLYEWMAICRGQLGAGREEVEELFRKAREIDPANEEVENNYQLYLDSLNSASPNAPPAWNRSQPRGMEDLFLSDRKSTFPDKFSSTSRVQHELQGAGN